MFRKLMAFVLCAVMLCTCAFSLADTECEISFKMGDALLAVEGGDQIGAMINEVLDITDIKAAVNENALALTLELKDTEITSLVIKADQKGAYVYCDLINEKPLFIEWQAAIEALRPLVNESLSGEEAAQANAFLDGLAQGLQNGFDMNTMTESSPVDTEALEALMSDEAIWTAIEQIMAKLSVEQGEFTAEGRDAADTKVTFSIDEKDIIAFLECESVQKLVGDLLSQSGQEVDMQAVIDSLKKEPFICDVEIWMNGEELVYLSSNAHEADGSEGALIEVIRLTGADGTAYTFTVQEYEGSEFEELMNGSFKQTATENGVLFTLALNILDDGKVESTLDAAVTVEDSALNVTVAISSEGETAVLHFDKTEAADGRKNGAFVMDTDAGQLKVVFDVQPTANGTAKQFDLYVKSVENGLNGDAPVITMYSNVIEKDDTKADLLDTMDLTNALDVLHMSEDELNELVNGISDNAMSKLYLCLSLLPSSVMNLLMGM